MKRLLALIFFLLLLLVPSLALASHRSTPSAPQAPEPPEAPGIPDVTGSYEVPQRPDLRVAVFAHPPRPKFNHRRPGPTPVSQQALVCNLEDPDSLATVAAGGWHLPLGNWEYRLNPSSVPSSVGGGNLNTIVTSGFNQYSQATSSKVNFVRGDDTTLARARNDGVHVVAWARLRGGTLGITYIWYQLADGKAVEVDTLMNTRYRWSWSNSSTCADANSYDAQNIMSHELGHWLGLDDMYDGATFQNATLYGYGALGEVKKNTLSTGDITGVSNIYSGL